LSAAHEDQRITEVDLADPTLRTARAYPAQAVWIGAFVALVGLLWAFHGSRIQDHQVVAEGLAVAVLGRGLGLGRPLLTKHLVAAVVLLGLSRICGDRGHNGTEQFVLIVAALAALWAPPAPKPGNAVQRQKIAALVDGTSNDCLAPFAQRFDKSYVFSPDGHAAMAYRVRWGVAVASGDPLGAPDSQLAAVKAFLSMAQAHGYRIGVLGAGEDWSEWWKQRGLRAVPVGRDVVIDVESFQLSGRAFRNLRQAVQRTRNFGVTTQIYKESELPAELYEHLRELVSASKRNPNRGFSMILDGLLEQQHPGTLIAVAKNADGEVVAFQRFATADQGREISQDLPWRAPGAPNGVDERLALDMVEWAKQHGGRRVSLSFAAFPELFENDDLNPAERAGYWAAHRLDPFIKLESLYRYLRKFHSMGRQRYAMVRLREVVPVASAMLMFEFGARRHRRSERRRWSKK
jgi:lysylphosphatidylglycerol synthetase-like protein (DUF2156 family)